MNSHPVEGAVVALYNTEMGFNLNDPNELVTFGETNKAGKVTLTGDLEAKRYYYDITHGASIILTNWTGGITTEDPLEENIITTLNIVIKESHVGYLAGEGKGWKKSRFFYNGDDVTNSKPECTLDDVLMFFKDLSFILSEGRFKCDEEDADQSVGHFTMSGSSMTIYNENGGSATQTVNIMSANEFDLIVFDAEGNEYRTVYTAVYN